MPFGEYAEFRTDHDVPSDIVDAAEYVDASRTDTESINSETLRNFIREVIDEFGLDDQPKFALVTAVGEMRNKMSGRPEPDLLFEAFVHELLFSSLADLN